MRMRDARPNNSDREANPVEDVARLLRSKVSAVGQTAAQVIDQHFARIGTIRTPEKSESKLHKPIVEMKKRSYG
jgi:hypothetical protein